MDFRSYKLVFKEQATALDLELDLIWNLISVLYQIAGRGLPDTDV
jgi:hypothetical protein